MTKLKKNKKSGTLPEWQAYFLVIIIVLFSVVLYFVPMVIKQKYVDQHFEKVNAEIIQEKEQTTGRGPSMRIYYYQYNYNNHSYTGKVKIIINDKIGKTGDNIVIRCRIEHPNVSYFNIDDNPSIKRYYLYD